MQGNVHEGQALNAVRRNAWCSSMDGGFVSSLVVGLLTAIAVVLIMIFCVVMQIWGCLTGGGGPRVTKDGPGTALNNSTPAAVLDSIREEFRALKKPVLVDFKHYRAYRTYPFGGVPCEIPEYWQPRVTDEARAFISRHANVELSVALFAMLDDPDMGGEAAVILGARPIATADSVSGRTVIGRVLHSSGYASPESPGRWNWNTAMELRRAVAEDIGDSVESALHDGSLGMVMKLLMGVYWQTGTNRAEHLRAIANAHHDPVSLSFFHVLGCVGNCGDARVVFARIVELRNSDSHSATNDAYPVIDSNRVSDAERVRRCSQMVLAAEQ